MPTYGIVVVPVDWRAAFFANGTLLAFPPVDLFAVCLVRAILPG